MILLQLQFNGRRRKGFARTRRGDCKIARRSAPRRRKSYVRKMHLKPIRKPNRLENYDYSQNGVYFLTFCTNERKQILSRIEGAADLFSLPTVHLTQSGQIINTAIEKIPERYPGVFVDRFVIIPNHVHLLVRIDPCGRFDNRPYERSVPSVGYIVRYCKGSVTRQSQWGVNGDGSF